MPSIEGWNDDDERAYIQANIAELRSLIELCSKSDVLGRRSLTSRLDRFLVDLKQFDRSFDADN